MQAARIDRRVLIATLAVATVIAFYTGFRMPNAWCATLQSASLFEACHRRWLVGTVLRPLVWVTGYNYRLLAAFSFTALAALLYLIWRAATAARHRSQALLVLTWLLLPTGGFLFHEVGYYEQVLYLLLFAAFALVNRGKLTWATCVMMLSPLVHESAVVTTLPIFGVYCLRKTSLSRATIAVALPLCVGLVQLAIAPGAADATDNLLANLRAPDFAARAAAARYVPTPPGVFLDASGYVAGALIPLAVFAAAAFAIAWRLTTSAVERRRDVLHVLASCLAIAAPVALMYGGADGNRWQFILITSLFLVTWIFLEHRDDELSTAAAVACLTAALLLSRVSLLYFDGLEPRALDFSHVRLFEHQLLKGTLFEYPAR